MRVVVQRVLKANLKVDGDLISEIGRGLLVFLGIEKEDTDTERDWLVHKLAKLRLFETDEGKMDYSLLDVAFDVMVVSQFTLFGNCRKGNRPSFNNAAPPEIAELMYLSFIDHLQEVLGKEVGRGVFGADMKIEALNDGPVTLIFDTRNKSF
jgi:D-aminoacyl-tRNA deacylase